MATEILKSFSHLQSELEEARSSLKGVDENIKKLIGRDPNEITPRQPIKRTLEEPKTRQSFSKFTRYESDDSPKPRRNQSSLSVFKRLSDKVPDDHVRLPSKGLISKVIAAPKEVPSRQAVLDKQNKDVKFKERNRRMFGALLGTLQRFQQEETKLKKKEDKRTQIEKKIEEHEKQEKEEIKKERQELFLNRKKKQQEIRMIELKMLRMKEYTVWEQTQKPRMNFIISKAKPHIHYLPRRMCDKSNELLDKSKKNIEEQIEKRRKEVFEELSHIEERMKKNFEFRNHIEKKEGEEEEQEKTGDKHDRHQSDSELDEDGDALITTLSPEHKPQIEEKVAEENQETSNNQEEENKTLNPQEAFTEEDSQKNETQLDEQVDPEINHELSNKVEEPVVTIKAEVNTDNCQNSDTTYTAVTEGDQNTSVVENNESM
ncbi:pinin [Anthonomus grandis grandis]|uniref:pinin n=1 Tax=Anthonomus grandis grandis TaxID=2921223 RepID=UPI00216652CE|nr:pinin [Anthonomus grandis grandis]